MAVVLTAVPLTEAQILAAGSRGAAEATFVRELAAEAFGVDVFILGSFNMTPATPHTVQTWMGDSIMVLSAQAHRFGTSVENATLHFDGDGRLTSEIAI